MLVALLTNPFFVTERALDTSTAKMLYGIMILSTDSCLILEEMLRVIAKLSVATMSLLLLSHFLLFPKCLSPPFSLLPIPFFMNPSNVQNVLHISECGRAQSVVCSRDCRFRLIIEMATLQSQLRLLPYMHQTIH